MSKIKNGGSDQYGTGPFEQRNRMPFGTIGWMGPGKRQVVWFGELLWANLLHISSCNMDRLNKIFNFVLLSYWLQRDGTGSEVYGTETGAGTLYQSRANT